MSDSLQPHRLQHTRLLCPPLSLGVCSCVSIELVMLSNHLILCCPLLLLLSVFPQIRKDIKSFPRSWLFTSGRQKYWSLNISPSNEYLGLISFRIDWLIFLQYTHEFSPALQLESIHFGAQPSLCCSASRSGLGEGSSSGVISFCLSHTAYGVLQARILEWFAIFFSSGLCFVRTLHYDPSVLSGHAQHGS